MNTSLYQIANEYQQVVDALLDSDLDEKTLADTIESIGGELETKAVNVAMFIRNIEASADQIKLAEKAMYERRKALENKAESVKRYLFENMKLAGVTKIECPYFALTIKKNPPSVVIDDLALIPTEYKIFTPPPPPSPDKAAIKAALQSGIEIDGAHIEQNERLEIK